MFKRLSIIITIIVLMALAPKAYAVSDGTGNDLFTGNVGIGSLTPGQRLDVGGTVRAIRFVGDGSGLTSLPAAGGAGSNTQVLYNNNGSVAGSNNFVFNGTNVGIGTTLTSNAQLEIDSGVVKIGSASPITMTPAAGSLYVQNDLEVDGNVWLGSVVADSVTLTGTTHAGSDLFDTLRVTGDTFLGTSAGNVGIGTFLAHSSLEIEKSGSNPLLMLSSSATGAGNMMYMDNGGNVGIGTNKTGSAGLAVMNGNVGIGTWVPATILHLSSSSAPVLRIEGQGTSGQASIQLMGGDSTFNRNVSVDLYNKKTSTTTARWRIVNDLDQNGSNDLRILKSNGSAAMTITSSGNIGLSTMVPVAALGVVGNIGIGAASGDSYLTTSPPSGGMIVEANVGIGTFSPLQLLDVRGTVSATRFIGDGSGLTNLPAAGGSGSNTQVLYNNNGAVAGSNNFVFNGTNVGIGTSVPAQSLDVESGNIGIGTTFGYYFGTTPFATAQTGLTNLYIGGAGNTTGGSGTNDTGIGSNALNGLTTGGYNLAIGAFSLYSIADGWNNTAVGLDALEYDVGGYYSTAIGGNAGQLISGGGHNTGATGSTFIGYGSEALASGDSYETVIGYNAVGSGSNTITLGGSGAVGVIFPYGNVGVGTTTPGQKLDVAGTVRAIKFIGDGSGLTNLAVSNNWIYNSSGNVGLSTTTAVGIGTSFVGGTGEAAFSVMNGNVGIGTWVPAGKFVVMNGNVGIGSIRPGALLSVLAPADSGQALFVQGGYGDGGVAAGGGITLITGGGDASGGQMTLSTGTGDPGGVIALTGQGGITMATGTTLSGTGMNISLTNANGTGANPGGSVTITAGNGGGVSGMGGSVTINPGALGGTGVNGNIILSNLRGNVGIGSLTPGQKLDVTGTVRAIQFIGDGSGLTNISGTPSGWTLGAINVGISTTNNVGIGTNKTTTAALTVMSGNVGIGTWVPSSALNVIGNEVLTVASDGQIALQSRSGIPEMISTNGAGTTVADLNLNFSQLHFLSGSVDFMDISRTNNNDTHFTTSSTLDLLGGNIGVGTTLPSGLLEVGNQKFDVLSGGNVGIGSINPGQMLDVSGTVRAIKFIGDGSQLSNIPASGWTLGTNNVGISTTNNVGIGTNLTTMAGLTVMNGNVGIGTWVPQATLDVNGTIRSNSSGVNYFGSNVGIGSTAPGVALDVTGEVRMTAFNLSTSPGANYILTSDASGNGAWSPSTGTVNTGTANQAAYYATSTNAVSGTSDLVFNGANVGIGSVNPIQMLDVSGTVRALRFIGDGSGLTNISGGSSGWTLGGSNIGISTTNNVGIGTNKTTMAGLTVMNGNVGIGTWVPGAYMLNVMGNVHLGPTLPASQNYGFEVNVDASTNYSVIIHGGSNQYLYGQSGNLSLLGNSTSSSDLGINGNVGVGSDYYSSHQAPTNGLIIEGNVGIGTWLPAQALDVIGTVRAIQFIGDGSGLTNISGGSSGWTLGGSNIGISTTNNVGIGTNKTTMAGLTVMNGNVGIGTWLPNSSLNVIGSIGVSITNPAKTSNYTATGADHVILVDAASGAVTITLPPVAGANGREYQIKKIDSSVNTVTIKGNSSELIDAANTLVTTTQYQSFTIVCDGVQWWVI